MFDTYDVTYVTTRGAGGSSRVPQHELHTWLAAHPSRLIVRLAPIYTTLEEGQAFRDAENAGKKNFALSIPRSIIAMQLPTAEQFEVFVPRNNGHVLVKVTVLNDRPSLDFIHTAFLHLIVEMLTKVEALPDGAERCVTVTDILTFAMQKYAS